MSVKVTTINTIRELLEYLDGMGITVYDPKLVDKTLKYLDVNIESQIKVQRDWEKKHAKKH